MPAKVAVTSFDEAAANIETYVKSLPDHPALAARLSMHPAWYAVRSESGDWLFGPSKFVGYRDASADQYLNSYDRGDGREAEPALGRFFVLVEDGALLQELRLAFSAFAARFGKVPKRNWRVSVPKSSTRTLQREPGRQVSERIAFRTDICGGRAHIAGTRVRVSDIVAALAAGESVEEIVAEFPYLTHEDIYAALDYAAKAVDHRVLRAA